MFLLVGFINRKYMSKDKEIKRLYITFYDGI